MRLRRILFVAAVNLVVALALLEGVLLALVHIPRLTAASPTPVRRLAQQVYRHFTRTLIQFDPACARYDDAVTYTLRPGGCTFGNLEFDNTYRINRLGLRDEDSALNAPEVIVLGDSHAMGWGVEQDETIAHIVAQATGLKVLNAAVSSYATVREMKTLDRLDTSRLRVLVVQYADNDLPENLTFTRGGNRLPITDRAHYDEIVRHYAGQRSYYPGKYVVRLFMKVSGLEADEPDQLVMPNVTPPEEAALFLNALEHAGRMPLDGIEVVVFAIHQDLEHPRRFVTALAEATRQGAAAFTKHLTVMDTSHLLTPDDFYVLDDHMRASGHRAVGTQLASLITDLLK